MGPVDGDESMAVTVPTFRPDVREGLEGEADVAEEVARLYGYSRLERRTPSWPQPGRLTAVQRRRRRIKDVLAGLGASEAWTAGFLSEADQRTAGIDGPYVEVTNPLAESERFLRASMVPGLLRALRFNVDRRHPELDLFEVGATFRPLPPGASAGEGRAPVLEVQRLGAVFAGPDADAWDAVAAWRTIADALRLDGWTLSQNLAGTADLGALHPTRSGILRAALPTGEGAAPATIGIVGEIHPSVVAAFDLVTAAGQPRRIGWLDLDLEVLFDDERVARRSEDARPVSRYPSADTDLAFVVDDTVPAGAVEHTLVEALGDANDSVELFDVYRGPSIGAGRRSLAFRLRFSALDHTLTEAEVADLRARCIEAVAAAHGAELRG
ncbi:MAG: hypothetical protein JO368_10195 [Acidimicrobiales bacterium]|nr:hypothetical protein [Acidimicrobiales bacterium]